MTQGKHNLTNLDFYLTNKAGTRIRTVYCQNKKFIYQTSYKYCDPLTFEEIFNHIKPYFDKYVEEYKNYKIQKQPITNSTFRLILFSSKEQKSIDYRDGKILFEIEIDNIDNNKIVYEFKNNFLFERDTDKIYSFYVNIEIELYNHKNFFQYDGEKDPIIEDVFILCKRNKPNVLITKCFHLVVCSDCNHFKNLNSCPRCNKPLADIHKVTFAVSSRK